MSRVGSDRDRPPFDHEPHADRGLQLRLVPFDAAEAAPLLAGADAYNESLYGHADQSPIDPTEFTAARRGAFMVALEDGRAVGCGGIRASEPPAPAGAAEIKRIFVVESTRRLGIAAALLAALEDAARAFGYREVVLDVGSKQPAAHAFYEKHGYTRIPGFSIYRDKSGNRAYGKPL